MLLTEMSEVPLLDMLAMFDIYGIRMHQNNISPTIIYNHQY